MSNERRAPFRRLLACAMAVALLGILLPLHSAQAVIIRPGDSMRVSFSFPSTPIGPGQYAATPADLLYANLLATEVGSNAGAGFGAPSLRFALYDGATLLGSYDQTFAFQGTVIAFGGPASLFNFRSTRIADFSSVASGLIDGELLITNISQPALPGVFPAVTIDASVSGMVANFAISSNGRVVYSPDAVIESQVLVASAIPEPASALLLGTLIGALTLGKRRIRRK